jgi:hypothetical protein
MPEQRTLIFDSRRDALGVGAFLIVCIAVSGIGGAQRFALVARAGLAIELHGAYGQLGVEGPPDRDEPDSPQPGDIQRRLEPMGPEGLERKINRLPV